MVSVSAVDLHFTTLGTYPGTLGSAGVGWQQQPRPAGWLRAGHVGMGASRVPVRWVLSVRVVLNLATRTRRSGSWQACLLPHAPRHMSAQPPSGRSSSTPSIAFPTEMVAKVGGRLVRWVSRSERSPAHADSRLRVWGWGVGQVSSDLDVPKRQMPNPNPNPNANLRS